MAIAPQELTQVWGVFKWNDYKYYDSGVLVNHPADPNH